MKEDEMKNTRDAGFSERMFMNLLADLQHISDPTETLEAVTADVSYMRLILVNVCYVGQGRNWSLIDMGLPGSASSIVKGAERLYGEGAGPSSVVLTHGHFDHTGAATELLEQWDVPVYAHEAEIPYLVGEERYVEPDPGVSKGLSAKIASLYPGEPIRLNGKVRPLPADGSVPGMPGWRWVHTPGHTPGHVVLFRDSDGALIVGDAFTTIEPERAAGVTTQEMEVHRPPKYFTPDWYEAGKSVKIIQELHPRIAVPSHSIVIRDEQLERQLARLVENFDEIAIPEEGMYVP